VRALLCRALLAAAALIHAALAARHCRYERAVKLGLSPPPEVHAALLRIAPGGKENQCLWAGRV
jgi:hypothetical protein